MSDESAHTTTSTEYGKDGKTRRSDHNPQGDPDVEAGWKKRQENYKKKNVKSN